MEQTLDKDNIGVVMSDAFRYDHGELIDKCLWFVDLHAPQALPHLHVLPLMTLQEVLRRESLAIKCEELSEIVIDWVEQKHVSPEDGNSRRYPSQAQPQSHECGIG